MKRFVKLRPTIRYIAILLLAFAGQTFAQTIPDYDRHDWNHWIDHDGDCLDTRHELLLRESLTAVTFKPNNNCLVEGGLWYGPFLGKFFIEASDLDVDHIIPLKWAHTHGGWRWTAEQKQAFANDYENLILVDDGRNQSKGSRGPSEWMPDSSAYHCAYIFKWSYLIDKYNLSANQADLAKIADVESDCRLN
jgi:hypothetical protein